MDFLLSNCQQNEIPDRTFFWVFSQVEPTKNACCLSAVGNYKALFKTRRVAFHDSIHSLQSRVEYRRFFHSRDTIMHKFLFYESNLFLCNPAFSWDYENFKLVKHVFVSLEVPELWVKLFWELLNVKTHVLPYWDTLNHILGTTQHRKRCFPNLKFTYFQ